MEKKKTLEQHAADPKQPRHPELPKDYIPEDPPEPPKDLDALPPEEEDPYVAAPDNPPAPGEGP